jgi:hypothetical protein
MRQLLESAKESTVITPFRKSKERRLWFLAIRKIAALKPDLVQELVLENSSGDQSKQMPPSEWTEEARALLTLASEQIEKDPKLAARLALFAMPLGLGAWPTFLARLSKRDPREAERVAMALILQLRDSSATSIALRNLYNFIIEPGRSSTLQNHFFQSLAIRLRRDIRPDASIRDLEHGLDVARDMSALTSARFPHWQDEFRSILLAYEVLSNERGLPYPANPRTRVISNDGLSAATPEDTQDIADAAAEVEKMAHSRLRDEAYQKLAIKAGHKADSQLADKLISRIEDPGIRRSATVRAYSPLVRKAIRESSWSEAQKQASKIEDPLGRTLVIHRIAQAMGRAGEDKYSVLYAYSTAASLLERETPAEQVAIGFLVLADALNSLDPQASVDALKSMARMLNKVVDNQDPLGNSVNDPAIASWAPLPDVSMNHDDVLDLADMIASTFKKVAKRDIDSALSAAYGIHHMGLYSLARLAIGSALLDRTKDSPGKPRQPKKTTM